MRSLARKICIVLLASGVCVPAEAGAPLAPGKPAGVAKAQEQTSSVLIYAGTLGIVAGSVALASSGGGSNGILGGTITTGASGGASSNGASGSGSSGNSGGGVSGTGSGANGGGTGSGGNSSGNQGGQTSGASGSVFDTIGFCNCAPGFTINTGVSTVTTTNSTH
jgi:hypothetical protein